MTDKSEMIFGVRAVIEAIQAGKEIDKILVKKDIQSDLSKELFAALKGLLIPVQRVPVERINLTSIKDEKFVKEMSEEADMIEQTTIAEEQKILDYVKTMF